jgi:hypothetical protein
MGGGHRSLPPRVDVSPLLSKRSSQRGHLPDMAQATLFYNLMRSMPEHMVTRVTVRTRPSAENTDNLRDCM